MKLTKTLALALLGTSFAPLAMASSLNVMLYHHVDDHTPHSTSTRWDDFIAQLDHFEEQGYQVLDLADAIKQLQAGQALPEKSVALTFDDAFVSVCERAYPELKRRGMPFTVFVATDPIDKGYQNYCSWEQLRELADDGVVIANHTMDHDYMVRDAFTNEAWFEQAKANVEGAQQRIKQQLGSAPMLFAYPYGEYNDQLKAWIAEQGYIAFGQQSGSIGETSDWQALPRFNAAGNYASVSSLRLKFTARPLALDYSALPDPLTQQRQPLLSVELQPSSEAHYPHLQCYLNGQALELNWHSPLHFDVTPPEALGNGRHRVNCTAPHRNGSPYYWLSQQWLVVDEQ
ncbi:polysaccharide deacetylase family protein [Aliagarivorans marinus]|uniref:polysaccharide deacetylase family protein n=1 Tax=Aliagarivorans marinus TaxID=561965 RepID=UPI0003FE05B6|nr:polysaccharide deacetylase family protein [Aliagarivorans marinus]